MDYNEVFATDDARRLGFLLQNQPWDESEPIFCAAAGNAAVNCLRMLLQRDRAGHFVKDYYGQTPVHRAIGAQDFNSTSYPEDRRGQAVEVLLAAGANPNERDNEGKTPLIIACENGDEKIVRLLLNRGADPNLPDALGKRAIDYAADYKAVFLQLSPIKDVCEPTGEVAKSFAKMGDDSPVPDLLKASRAPVHAALLLAAEFDDQKNEGGSFQAESFEQMAKICGLTAANLLTSMYDDNETSFDDIKRFAVDAKINGKSAAQMAVDQGNADFAYSTPMRKMISSLWEGSNSRSEPLLSRMFFRPLERPLGYMTYDECWWSTPQGRYAAEFVLYVFFLLLHLRVLFLGALARASFAEVLLYILTAGYIANEVRSMYQEGLSSYFNSIWNVLDTLMYGTLLVCAIMRVAGLVRSGLAGGDTVYETLVCVSFLLWFRALNILQLSSYLGPLVSAVVAMIKEVAKYVVLVAIVMVAFAQVLYFLFQHRNPKEELTFGGAINYLFNTFFGNFDLNDKDKTEAVGAFWYFVVGAFACMGTLLLFNLLVAILSNLYGDASKNAKKEYQLGLLEQTLEYRNRGQLLPCPLNLINLLLFPLPRRVILAVFSLAFFLAVIVPGAVVASLVYIVTFRFTELSLSLRRVGGMSLELPTDDRKNKEYSALGADPTYRPANDDIDEAYQTAESVVTATGGTGSEEKIAQIEAKVDKLTKLVGRLEGRYGGGGSASVSRSSVPARR